LLLPRLGEEFFGACQFAREFVELNFESGSLPASCSSGRHT
jgi:hypothetical protein